MRLFIDFLKLAEPPIGQNEMTRDLMSARSTFCIFGRKKMGPPAVERYTLVIRMCTA